MITLENFPSAGRLDRVGNNTKLSPVKIITNIPLIFWLLDVYYNRFIYNNYEIDIKLK